MNKSDKTYDYNSKTIDNWKDTIQTLQLYIEFDEKSKIMAPTLVEYVLATLQLMAQVKGQYSEDSFIIALIKYAELQQKKIKKFLSIFVNSFALQLKGNQEICYFTYMLSSDQLIKANSEQFSFYLKIRKYIFTNFINERDTKIKPLTFDQWVSVVSKQMDNQAISLIGNRIRDEVGEKVKDKILKNSVMPYDLIIYCYELQSERYQQQQSQIITQQPQPRQIATFSPQQQQQEEQQQQQQIKPTQQKQKQKKQDDFTNKMKEVVLIHENLATNYNKLVDFAQKTQNLLSKTLQQIKKGEQLNDQDIEELNKIIKFQDFLKNDPEETLQKSGIYDFF